MQLFADYHTHTLYSDGHGTIEENARAAATRGLKRLAITDHGPGNIGTGVRDAAAFAAIRAEAAAVNAKLDSLQVLVGVEADVISRDGRLDVPAAAIKDLDLLIVGLHPYVWPGSWADARDFILPNHWPWLGSRRRERLVNTNTKALVAAIYNHRPDIVSHPNLGMPVNLAEIARACAKCGTALEINVGHPYAKDDIIIEALCQGAGLVVNSDAHFPEHVGLLKDGLELLQRRQVLVEQVYNALPDGEL